MDAPPASTPSGTGISSGLAPGQMLKHFRIEGFLGEGGMGRVYRAYDTRLRRAVAIKALPAELTADPERKQRFVQEAHAAACISHPAVAHIFDADEQAGVTFIVMEMVEGKTVRQLVDNKELDLPGIIDIAIQVADGLSKAHELGIVHRDIKPANVMRTGDGHVKILDFGLAKLVGANPTTVLIDKQQPTQTQVAVTRPDIVMGTPAYMSPEQVRGLPVDARTDIFGVGVLLFEMATGQSPFRRANPMDALHAAAFEEAPPMNSIRPDIPDEFQRVVTRCLKKDPEQRYASARLLMDDLRRIRRDTEAGRPLAGPWQQKALDLWQELRHLPRSRHLWYAAGLAVLVIAAGVFLWRMRLENFLLYAVVILVAYRFMRNRPQHAQAELAKRLSKIPEVRLVVFREHHADVVVDCPVPQLYLQINEHLRSCNQSLFFGAPMTLTILYDVPPGQMQSMLSGPGVQYVRRDVLEKTPAVPPRT